MRWPRVSWNNGEMNGDRKAGNIVSLSPPGRLLHGQVPPGGVVAGGGQVGVPVVLGLLEVVEHVLVAPARVAGGLPVVVVPPVAAHVEHVVEDGGAAQHLAAGPVTPLVSVTQTRPPRLRLGLTRGAVISFLTLLLKLKREHQRHFTLYFQSMRPSCR